MPASRMKWEIHVYLEYSHPYADSQCQNSRYNPPILVQILCSRPYAHIISNSSEIYMLIPSAEGNRPKISVYWQMIKLWI